MRMSYGCLLHGQYNMRGTKIDTCNTEYSWQVGRKRLPSVDLPYRIQHSYHLLMQWTASFSVELLLSPEKYKPAFVPVCRAAWLTS